MATDYKDIIVRFRAEVKDLEKGLQTVEKSLGDTSKEAEKQSAKWVDGFNKASKAGMAFGAAGVSVAAGIDALIERNKTYEKSLGKTSITTGIAKDELRALSMEAYDATTPLDEVNATLDALGRTGIKNADDMKIASKGILELADANDVAGDTLVRGLSPALKAFNIDIKNSAAYSDILTYALNNTTYEFSEYSNILEKTAPRAQEVDISFKGLNAVILALSERGVDGKTAITQITQALDIASASTDESKDKLTVFLETLGMSPAEIAKYTTAMDGASGITKKYAENTQQAAGVSGELKVAIDKLTLGAGQTLAPFESLNTGLGAVSGTMMTTAGTVYLLSSAYTALGASAAAAAAAMALPVAAAAGFAGLGIAAASQGAEPLQYNEAGGDTSQLTDAQKEAYRRGLPWATDRDARASLGWPTQSGGGCFVPGTPITMADGTKKPIEYVHQGDTVQCFDPATGETHAGRVAETMRYQATMLHTLCFEDGAMVKCTGEHPFYVGASAIAAPRVHERFVRAHDLMPGDVVVRINGAGRIREVVVQECNTTVYNFNVMPWHTYVAGGCLVHNVKAMAEGGIVTGPTYALIGEAGPEAVIPLKNGGISTGTGDQPTIINVNVGDGYRLAQVIIPHLKAGGRYNAGVR